MRVSENTAQGSVQEALRRSRGRMEELQIKNSIQKKLIRPSDDPSANTKIMDIRTTGAVHSQFENNAVMAKNRLSFTDSALSELYDIFVRAKEIAISQSSDASASVDSRTGVAQEVTTLTTQLMSIANRRVGPHYLFSGFKTQTAPYNKLGQYFGDSGEIPIEIETNVFTPINLPGPQVFEVKRYNPEDLGRKPAEIDRATGNPSDDDALPPIEEMQAKALESVNLFHELDALRVGLVTNDTIAIRERLEPFDRIIENIITLRTKLSSRVSGIDAAISTIQKTDLSNAELASQMEDADFSELWSNLAREETVLRSSLSAAQKLIQPTLLDFLK